MNEPSLRERETLPLLKTGDSFRKMVVSDGNQQLWTDDAGISYVGILQMLLNEDVMNRVLGV